MKNRDRQLKTIETTLHKYAQNLDQLYKLEKEVREQAFTQYLKDLTRAEDADHIKIFSQGCQATSCSNIRSIPEGDFAQWKADLEKL